MLSPDCISIGGTTTTATDSRQCVPQSALHAVALVCYSCFGFLKWCVHSCFHFTDVLCKQASLLCCALYVYILLVLCIIFHD